MRSPASVRIRYRVQPRGLWPDGRVIDQWMNPTRTHCFVLLDTGWVISIDAESGLMACAELLEAEQASDRFEYGAFFGDEHCRLFVVTKGRECFFFALEQGSPARLAQRVPVGADGVLSMRPSLDRSRLVVHGVNRAWVFVASTLELDDVDAYPSELREWSGLLVRGHDREVVRCDASGVRVFSEDRAPWQCVRFDGGGFTQSTGTSATTLLTVQRSANAQLKSVWHVDLAQRTAHDLRAMGVSRCTGALACGPMLALSRDRTSIDLVDLDRRAIVATLQVGLHTLIAMDLDRVFVLRDGALSRVDVRDGSVTDVGEHSSEEAAPIASVFVTDRGELVTVNGAGRRCAYDSDGALVAEINEPLSVTDGVRFMGSSDGDAFVFEQLSLASRETLIIKRSLAGRDLLQEVDRLLLPRGEFAHGCTTQGRILFSFHANAGRLSISSRDLSRSESIVGYSERVAAFGVSAADDQVRLQCVERDTYDADGNPAGPPPREFLLYIAQSGAGDARVSKPFPLLRTSGVLGPFDVFEGASGERFLRMRVALRTRGVLAFALTRDQSLGCVATDEHELVFCNARARRETRTSYAGWLAAGEVATGCRFSTQATHIALSTSLGRVFVATLEEAQSESGSRDE